MALTSDPWTELKLDTSQLPRPVSADDHNARGVLMHRCLSTCVPLLGARCWHTKHTGDPAAGKYDYVRVLGQSAGPSDEIGTFAAALSAEVVKQNLGTLVPTPLIWLDICKAFDSGFRRQEVENFLPIWHMWSVYFVERAKATPSLHLRLAPVQTGAKVWLCYGLPDLLVTALEGLGDPSAGVFVHGLHAGMLRDGWFVRHADRARETVFISKRHLLLNVILENWSGWC